MRMSVSGKGQLSGLVKRAKASDEIVLTRFEHEFARLLHLFRHKEERLAA